MKFTIIIIELHETLGYSLLIINLSRVESSTTGLKMFASADEEIKHKHEIKSFINPRINMVKAGQGICR